MQFKIISIAAALTIGVLALPIPNLANEDLVLNPEVPETTPMEKRDIGFTAGSLEARQKYFEGRVYYGLGFLSLYRTLLYHSIHPLPPSPWPFLPSPSHSQTNSPLIYGLVRI